MAETPYDYRVTNSGRRALLVFTRSPEAEASSKGFRPERGAPLFRAFLSSWVDLAREAAVHLVVASPAACRRRLENSRIAPDATFQTQRGARFEDRLADSAHVAFDQGFESVIIVGGDAPAIAPDELRSAFAALEAGKTVVGPSLDGGIYLIGLRAPETPLLRTITLGDSRVCERFAQAGEDAGRRIHFLSWRGEIDSVLDARRVWKASPGDSNWAAFRLLLATSVASRPIPVTTHLFILPGVSGLRRSPRAPPAMA